MNLLRCLILVAILGFSSGCMIHLPDPGNDLNERKQEGITKDGNEILPLGKMYMYITFSEGLAIHYYPPKEQMPNERYSDQIYHFKISCAKEDSTHTYALITSLTFTIIDEKNPEFTVQKFLRNFHLRNSYEKIDKSSQQSTTPETPAYEILLIDQNKLRITFLKPLRITSRYSYRFHVYAASTATTQSHEKVYTITGKLDSYKIYAQNNSLRVNKTNDTSTNSTPLVNYSGPIIKIITDTKNYDNPLLVKYSIPTKIQGHTHIRSYAICIPRESKSNAYFKGFLIEGPSVTVEDLQKGVEIFDMNRTDHAFTFRKIQVGESIYGRKYAIYASPNKVTSYQPGTCHLFGIWKKKTFKPKYHLKAAIYTFTLQGYNDKISWPDREYGVWSDHNPAQISIRP